MICTLEIGTRSPREWWVCACDVMFQYFNAHFYQVQTRHLAPGKYDLKMFTDDLKGIATPHIHTHTHTYSHPHTPHTLHRPPPQKTRQILHPAAMSWSTHPANILQHTQSMSEKKGARNVQCGKCDNLLHVSGWAWTRWLRDEAEEMQECPWSLPL